MSNSAAETAPIGLIVNPRSGNDVRRVVASAGSSTLDDKTSIVRRIVRGAVASGVTRFVTNREPHHIVRRATETMTGVHVDYAVAAIDNSEGDSTEAARAMRDIGCAVVVVLGGDGTNRAVCKGWFDVPLIPLSTGTNNAFPVWCEPTVAGLAAALVARGVVAIDDVSAPAKLVHVDVVLAPENRGSNRWDRRSGVSEEPDIALIDAAAVVDPFVGSLELFEPATMRLLMLTRADPSAIGFSAVGGLLHPVSDADDHGLCVTLCDPGVAAKRLMVATAPGHLAMVGIEHHRLVGLGERVTIDGPAILAFDGERKRRLLEGDRATLTIRRDGPRVIDVGKVMRFAARTGFFTR
ncbi:MAG: NAD(+)/NADH kinase [Acidimicrobiales bacterium]